MRDLTGLAFVTLAGGLAGRWPLSALFFPWRGTWQQSVPAGPNSAFDLSGLNLPPHPGVRHLTTIQLIIDDPASQTLPWEQWLGLAEPAGQEALIWYRRMPGRPVTMSIRGWSKARAIFRGPRHLMPEAQDADEGAALRILYLVTTPVPTHAGWRLRVIDDTGRGLGVVSRGKHADEALLSIDQFPLKNTAVVVLQADPVDKYPESLRDLRAGVIGCAQDFLAGGASSVLVIPPLPDDLARKAVEIVWRAIARKLSPPSPMVLLRTAARLKRLIANAPSHPDETESAVLDVLIFLRTADRATESVNN
jgi:hypothetical protein